MAFLFLYSSSTAVFKVYRFNNLMPQKISKTDIIQFSISSET